MLYVSNTLEQLNRYQQLRRSLLVIAKPLKELFPQLTRQLMLVKSTDEEPITNDK